MSEKMIRIRGAYASNWLEVSREIAIQKSEEIATNVVKAIKRLRRL